jgi:hypothetical protein
MSPALRKQTPTDPATTAAAAAAIVPTRGWHLRVITDDGVFERGGDLGVRTSTIPKRISGLSSTV